MQTHQDSFDGTFTENIRGTAYKNQYNGKKHKILFNVAETQYAVVKHVAKKNKFNMLLQPTSNLNFDVCWTDNHVKQDLFARMQSHQKINHFPGMTILSRKNNLGTNLMHFRTKFPGEYQFFPITWSLPNDYSELLAYHECRQQGKAQTFIVKPEAGCQGRGIYLTRNIEKIKYDRCVVQRYMHKPLLIDGLKFDLRIYVLVAGIDPLRIFVFEEGLARFATEQYRAPRSENLQNKFMHLTNYAINKENPNFIFNQSVTNMDIGHKRSLTSVYKKIEEEGHNVEDLKKKINDIFIKTIITGYPTLSQTVSSVHADNFANDMCFEILGFDIMIDSKLNPYLLEINYTPSFTADTPLDRHIKKNLIGDTLNILNINEKWKKEAKAKRDKEVQERMVTGKRKKYTQQERKALTIEEARKRDEYEAKNMGKFTKIFLLNEEQLHSYQKYYDFSMELYQSLAKLEEKNISSPSQVYHKNKEYIPYLNYFSSQAPDSKKEKKTKETNREKVQCFQHQQIPTKNYSKNFKENTKENDMAALLNKSGQENMMASVSIQKRVSSAKSRKEKKEQSIRRVVYEGVNSKKSLKIEQSRSNNRERDDEDPYLIENSSMFQNKNLQQIGTKGKWQRGNEEEVSVSHDFN